MGDFWLSSVLFFKVKCFHFQEAKQVRRLCPGFSIYDRALKKIWRFRNPYTLCKKHLIRQGKALADAYGETPLPVLARIADEVALCQEDHLLELGCGRGRGVFFLSYLSGCSVTGVDWVPFFITSAQTIAQSTAPSLPVTFRCETMETADLAGASVIYLYGTCLADEEINTLVIRFEVLPPSTRIITVSYPLCAYSSKFHTLKQFTVEFPWGEGEVFINGIRL